MLTDWMIEHRTGVNVNDPVFYVSSAQLSKYLLGYFLDELYNINERVQHWLDSIACTTCHVF